MRPKHFPDSTASHLPEGEGFPGFAVRSAGPLDRELRKIRLDRLADGLPDRAEKQKYAVNHLPHDGESKG